MRSRIILVISLVTALAAVVGLPWLAWQEAQRQAFDAAAEMTRTYARAVLHRADKTADQANAAIGRLARLSHDPCSQAALAMMREIDLTSTYLQAVGYVRAGALVCSSLGGTPIPLGAATLQTSTGVAIYPHVPVLTPAASPLFALERGNIAVLVHRELPLDIATAIPGTSLAVLHLEARSGGGLELVRGTVRRDWLKTLGNGREASFVSDGQLVAAIRSSRYLTAAVAAVPEAYLSERGRAIAWRLVPAAALAGSMIALAVLALARQQRSVAAALRLALRHHEFYLQYQPIVELSSGRCVGVEALLRWRRATGELFGPDLFIPVAEETGLITRLTERVFDLAAADAGPFLAAHPDFHIAFNLSAADLRSSAIIDLVERFLQRTGGRPSNLLLEITERGFLDMDSTLPVLAALRERGIAVAIDDFGTGYSSLSYLESLALDYLKIDRSFIEAIGTRAPTSQVVGHIIAMARTMDLRMIAEGVESEAQADFLRAQSVQYAQGWLFGRPMPFQEAIRLAAQEPARDHHRQHAG